ncbi:MULTISPECIES: hypothetical protein [unclassified Pseudomonas]|uniref:hypothetical protein n=1 Tax=unclassified Pseudomonas TaxID=196821 RepID=UPI00244A8AD7|nr:MULTISPECIES: hypothetical protein [unclassified Pseudomonas]MDG9923006.1 hypothetical protein [Pseudomonas sp. GD04045]MDH0035630.1 hypothetical protein [Pseudomonas sp. GD04019]
MPIARHLLWIDSAAALMAGCFVLPLATWLSELYRLPHGLLPFIGTVNLLYAGYAGSLAIRRERPRALLYVLIIGNSLWMGVCLALALRFANQAAPLALAHLIGEALFVGALAACEWRWRGQICASPQPA